MTSQPSSITKVGLHPLAISSICDHSTKVLFGGTKQAKSSPALGLLFGFQDKETVVEICDAIDLPNALSSELLPFGEVDRKNRLLVEVFPSYKLMGWYITGKEIQPHHIALHKALYRYNPNPIFLLLNPNLADASQLPISIYSLCSENSAADPQTSSTDYFVNIPYSLATNQAEEISIDSITKQASFSSNSISRLEINAQGMMTSLKELEEQIEIVIQGLERMMQSGVVDHQVLRMSNHVMNMLTIVNEAKGRRDGGEAIEHELMSFLAVSTKALTELHQLIDLTSIISQDKSYY
jgi:COP9 signalosome complex subunit 6